MFFLLPLNVISLSSSKQPDYKVGKAPFFSFLPIITIPRNKPDRGRLKFSTISIIIPSLLLASLPSTRKRPHLQQSPWSNTRILCQSLQEQTVLTLSKKAALLNSPWKTAKDSKPLRTYCNKKHPRRKSIHVYSASKSHKLCNFYSPSVEEERANRQVISAFHWKLPPLFPEISKNAREK